MNITFSKNPDEGKTIEEMEEGIAERANAWILGYPLEKKEKKKLTREEELLLRIERLKATIKDLEHQVDEWRRRCWKRR